MMTVEGAFKNEKEACKLVCPRVVHIRAIAPVLVKKSFGAYRFSMAEGWHEFT
ncbi:hypothetical protein NC979_21525 [Leptolyngbya subtilissima AS-A7]